MPPRRGPFRQSDRDKLLVTAENPRPHRSCHRRRVTARINLGFFCANHTAQYPPSENPMTPNPLPTTAGCWLKVIATADDLEGQPAPHPTETGAVRLLQSFGAILPENISGARATKPAPASRSQTLLKKSFRPHQACRTKIPGPRRRLELRDNFED